MKPDFDKMTLDELEAWLICYTTQKEAGRFLYKFGLDAADAAMPEGWEWWKLALGTWVGQSKAKPSKLVSVCDTGNKVRDLFCLACKCRWAEKEAQQ